MAVDKAEGRGADAGAEAEVEEAEPKAAVRITAKDDVDDAAVEADNAEARVGMSNPSKTMTSHRNPGRGSSSFIPMDTDSYAAQTIITLANGAIHSFLER